MLTAAEAVTQLAEIHEREAVVVEKYDPRTADIIRRISGSFRQAVTGAVPEWVALTHVSAIKGWSQRHLRQLCQSQFEPEGLAKQRRRGGRWLIHRDAIGRIPLKPEAENAVVDLSDISEAARRLGAED